MSTGHSGDIYLLSKKFNPIKISVLFVRKIQYPNTKIATLVYSLVHHAWCCVSVCAQSVLCQLAKHSHGTSAGFLTTHGLQTLPQLFLFSGGQDIK